MKTYIKNILIILLFSLAVPTLVIYGQVIMSASVAANGGGEMTGSHVLAGTFGQAAVGTSGTILNTGFWYAAKIVTEIKDKTNNTIPKEYKLNQNYPNPFNPSTIIEYSLPALSAVETRHALSVQLIIYDMLGREVAVLVNGKQEPGYYKVNFDASNLSSGIYFYRISAGQFVSVKKMILLK